MGLKYVEKTDEEIAYFNMFQRFKINIPEKTIQIKSFRTIFEYIVNRLTEILQSMNCRIYKLKKYLQ